MIGFPGLGIEKITLSKTLFTIGSFGLTWYGVIIAAGFLTAVLYCLKRSKEFNLTQDEIIDMLIFAVPSAVVGARLLYCISYWEDFENDVFGVFRIMDGGLSIFGGIIGALIAAGLFCWVRHIHAGAMFDIGALGLLIGQTIGRWGNLPNVEVYGKLTDLPWRMRVYRTVSNYTEVHPLFLYESLWNALGFVLIHFLSKKRKFNGQVFLCYLAWYGLGRGVMESLRDPYYIMTIGENIHLSQLIAFISAVLALLALGYMLIFKSNEPAALTRWVDTREAWRASLVGGGEENASGTTASTEDENAEGDTQTPPDEGTGEDHPAVPDDSAEDAIDSQEAQDGAKAGTEPAGEGDSNGDPA